MRAGRPRLLRATPWLVLAAWLALAPVPGLAQPPAGTETAAPDSATPDSGADSAGAAFGPHPEPAIVRPDTAAAAALLDATAAPADSAEVSVPPAPAPVFLARNELVRIRTAREGLSPVERATAIRRRLDAIVADRSIDPDSVKLVRAEQGVEVRVGGTFLMMITPGDAPTDDPHALGLWFAGLVTDTQEGLREERRGRTPVRLLISAGLALVFTLIAIALFRVLLLLSRRWHRFLVGYLRDRLPAIRFRNFEVLSRAQLSGAVLAVLDRLDIAAGILLVYAWLTSVFSLFPYTQGWAWLLLHFATENFIDFVRNMGAAVPGLLVIVVIFTLFRWLAQISDRFFKAIRDGQLHLPGFHPDLARPSRRLVRIGLWIVALMISYPYIPGAQSRAVQGVSILLGVMVSIGSTSVVGNVLSGLVLTYSRSFRPGDRVRIGEHTGDVIELGFFATKLRTIRNEEITIPNGRVAAGSIVNYTRMCEEGPGLVLVAAVTIGYDAEWRKVHELLAAAARRVEGIEQEPAPRVYQTALGDWSVRYELTATTRDSHEQQRLYSDLHAAIQDAFNEAGVEIMSPAYTALRDGHPPAMPREPEGPRPEPGAFRVSGPERTSEA